MKNHIYTIFCESMTIIYTINYNINNTYSKTIKVITAVLLLDLIKSEWIIFNRYYNTYKCISLEQMSIMYTININVNNSGVATVKAIIVLLIINPHPKASIDPP